MTKGYLCINCGSQVVGHSATECDLGRTAMLFEQWWADDGQYVDPDTDDVPWFDKRKELAAIAYAAGRKSAGYEKPREQA